MLSVMWNHFQKIRLCNRETFIFDSNFEERCEELETFCFNKKSFNDVVDDVIVRKD